MCGRYHLDPVWQEDKRLDHLKLEILDPVPELWAGSKEVFPRTYQPIIREYEGRLIVERRRWGFHRT